MGVAGAEAEGVGDAVGVGPPDWVVGAEVGVALGALVASVGVAVATGVTAPLAPPLATTGTAATPPAGAVTDDVGEAIADDTCEAVPPDSDGAGLPAPV